MGSGVNYTLIFKNNSTNSANACVYQQDPNIGVPDVMSLAWFSKYAFPTTTVTFQWTIDYSFVWSETGVLVPGVIFTATQNWGADLSTTNQVTFSHPGQAYTFQNQTAGPQGGSLYITEDGTLPIKQASVGIGMGGFGTFVVQAQPNWNLVFTPHPEYWITFGNYTQGEVLDQTSISNPAKVAFPVNTYSMTAILNPDNTWTVMPTSNANAKYLDAKKKNPKALWGVL